MNKYVEERDLCSTKHLLQLVWEAIHISIFPTQPLTVP